MSNELTRPSINLLPMDDIEQELNNIYRREDDDPEIEDIIKAYLQIQDPEEVAIVLDTEDRQTVENATKLDGRPAADYLLEEESKSIYQNSHKEIAALRDEVYQLKNELIKRGLLNHTRALSGFYDPFLSGNILYDQQTLGGIESEIQPGEDEIIVADSSIFREGEYITICDGENFVVRKVEDNEAADKVELHATIPYAMSEENVDIYKYSGQYLFGSYGFLEDGGEGAYGSEQYTTVDDERNKDSVELSGDTKGCAYTFTISDSLVNIEEGYLGYLSKFEIYAKAVDLPGNLSCYIVNLEDMGDFDHVNNNNALAVSQPAEPAPGESFKKIVFNFDTGSGLPEIVSRDSAEEKKVYCAVVIEDDTGAEGHWEIRTVRSEDPGTIGLQQNNIFYEYNHTGVEASFETDDDINANDLWMRAAIIDHVIKDWMLHKEGLYTSSFGICEPAVGSTARVTMRINKEGQQKTIEPVGSKAPGEDISYAPAIDGFEFSKDHPVVLGSKIKTISESSLSKVSFMEGCFIEEYNTPIYPVNYRIFLLARYKYFDTGDNIYKYDHELLKELPLKYVVDDPHKSNTSASGRLIFEAELAEEGQDPQLYNDFQLQIYWKSPASEQALLNNQDLAGRIHELTVTFDNNTGEGVE